MDGAMITCLQQMTKTVHKEEQPDRLSKHKSIVVFKKL